MNTLSRLSLGLLAASLGLADGATLLGQSAGLTVTAVLEKAGGSFASDEDAAQGEAVDAGSYSVHGSFAAGEIPVFGESLPGMDDPLTTLTLAQATLSAMMEEALSASGPTGRLDFFSLNPGAIEETDATIAVSSVISAYVGSTTFLRTPNVFWLADTTGPAGALHQALTMSDAGAERWRR